MTQVNRVRVVYMDDEGNPKKAGGETDPDVILRELPFKVRAARTLHPTACRLISAFSLACIVLRGPVLSTPTAYGRSMAMDDRGLLIWSAHLACA